MPYIRPENRESVDHAINEIVNFIRTEYTEDGYEGMLNYVITRITAGVFASFIIPRYKWINRAVGVFECAKLEFYRRQAVPYEDKQICQNGDIPEYE